MLCAQANPLLQHRTVPRNRNNAQDPVRAAQNGCAFVARGGMKIIAGGAPETWQPQQDPEGIIIREVTNSDLAKY